MTATAHDQPARVVEVTADVSCPFAHFSLRVSLPAAEPQRTPPVLGAGSGPDEIGARPIVAAAKLRHPENAVETLSICIARVPSGAYGRTVPSRKGFTA